MSGSGKIVGLMILKLCSGCDASGIIGKHSISEDRFYKV
jgi:hypothetical protein